MAPNSEWCDLGPIEQFTKRPLTATKIGTTRIVVTHRNGEFGTQLLLDHEKAPHSTERGGRKSHRVMLEELGTDEVAGEMVM